MKKILVTGGAGFIGSNYIRFVLEKYRNVKIINFDKLTYAGNLQNLSVLEKDQRYTFIRGDICDPDQLSSAIENSSPDFIVNFAAETHVDRSISNPGIFIRSNVVGVQNLLDCSLQFNVKKYLQISTDEVYGSLGNKGLFSETTPLAPHSPYSASKASADLLTQSYFHTFDLPINITRSSNNYGPYQFPEKLIPLTILKCLKKEKIPIYGKGRNIRDWIHVMDNCSAIDLVLRKGMPGEIYNVGANNEISNIQMVRLIIKKFSELRPRIKISDKLISFVEDRKGHDWRYAINSEKIKRELGWKPKVSFDIGLRNTIQWYLQNLEEVS